jgi:hypothetical protein
MLILHHGSIGLAGDPSDYQSYRISFGRDVTVKGACERVECPAWKFGWDTAVDEQTDLGKAQAAYIRTQSGRTFKEMKSETGQTVFRFEPHQRCFAEHKTRPEVFSVRLGDFRANYGLLRRHTRALDWAEDCAEHQQTVAERVRKYHG